MKIPHTKHVLANGLEVALHQDRSDPLVAVYLTYHVGSARERRGLSGFAHLFEHMLFQGSENVPEGEFFRRIQAAGGTLNGSTNQDRTNYYEVLPSNALELALFLEADRMGRLLPAMTQAKLDNQRDVVKNERRQNYDNRPYGCVHETILEALYPEEHPYSWSTIGSMEDIDGATLEDVASFFRRWYGPNNASLAIGGDFDPEEALALVEKYFGDLAPCPPVDSPAPRPAAMGQHARIVHEDRIRQSQLSLVWPTVHAWHPDEPALNLLADILSANKASLFDRVLLLEERLASHVTIWPHAGELAGFLRVDLRPTPGQTLGRLEQRVDELLESFLNEPLDDARLERLKARREGAVVRSLESVSARTNLLSHYNCFHREPDRLEEDLERHRAVTAADILRVAEKWIVGRARVGLSAVPVGKAEEASDSTTALVSDVAEAAQLAPREPRPAAATAGPEPWHAALSTGVPLIGTRFDGVPLARLSLSLGAGRLRETPANYGAASLCAELLDEGTQSRSSTEWTDALDGLGATLGIRPGNDELVLTLTALEAKFDESVRLLEELVRGPRFDKEDFERSKALRLVAIDTQADRAGEHANEVFRNVIHGQGAMGAPQLGTRATIESMSVSDIAAFWEAGAGMSDASIAYVGMRSPEEVRQLLEPWSSWWTKGEKSSEEAASHSKVTEGLRITLVPKEGAPQAELRVGHPSVSRSHPDFDALRALNHLFGGSFTSRLNLNLREDKGYTYGVRSSFVAGRNPGRFVVATGVDTENAVAALREILKEMAGIQEGLRPEEVEFARTSLSQALALAYESTASKLGLLERLAKYGLPDDYVAGRHAWLTDMTAEPLNELARRFLHPEALDVVVVGDPEALRADLEGLGSLRIWGSE